MDASIFVSDAKQPLLEDYELLDDPKNNVWEWSTGRGRTDNEGGLLRSLLPPIRQANGSYSTECVLDDIYRYYLLRGLWKYIACEVGQLVLLTWLVLFCIFLGTCVDYVGILNLSGGGNSLWQYVDFAQFRQMSWYFVTALVLFGIYAMWRFAKFLRDVRRMVRVREFYAKHLKMSDFELRTARWADVLERLCAVEAGAVLNLSEGEFHRMQTACQSPSVVAALITKKENFFKKLLELGHFNFVLNIRIPFRNTVLYQSEVMLLTRGLQWNITYCIVNYFFDSSLQIKQLNAEEYFVTRLKTRIVVLALLNILLLPFLVVFVALYAVFRYGEQFYKNPGSIGTRQWSLAARWYFRDYDELPHVLEERLRIGTRFANQYTAQFAASALEGAARCVAFIVGSVVVWMLALSFINERALLGLEVSPGKGLLWWITVLSSVWVLTRGLLQEQHVFYPKDALHVVYELTRRLPVHFMENPGSKLVLSQFHQLFPLQIYLLFLEFIGLVATPWILLWRIYPKAEEIVKAVRDHVQFTESKQFFMGLDLEQAGVSESVTDFKEDVVLRSENLVPYLQRLATVVAPTF